MKKAKLDYRAAFKEVKEIKDDISTLEESINSTRVKLVEGAPLHRLRTSPCLAWVQLCRHPAP